MNSHSQKLNRGNANIFLWCFLLMLFVVATGVALKQNFAQPGSPPPQFAASQIENLWTRQAGDDWPAFLGPNGDGKSKETGILQDWSQGKLKALWKTTVGEGYGIGSVADGRYFHFDRHDGRARVRCLHAETGKELWEFRYDSNYRDMYGYDSGPRASPVIDGPRVYVFGVEGIVYCLAADSGKELWNLDTSKKFNVIQNFFGVASSPVVYEDLLLLMVGGSPADGPPIPPGQLNRVKPNGSGIVAVDKLTGAIRYQVLDELASYSSIKLAEGDGQQVAFAWLRGSLVGFFPKTGKSFLSFPWRSRKLESVNASMPVVVDDHVLVSECYEIGSALLKWSTTGCDVRWSDKGKRDFAMRAHWNTPIVIDGKLYGCSGRNSGDAELRCIDFLTGEVHWRERGFTRSSLTYIDGHFVLLDEQGQLVLFKASPEKYQQVTAYEETADGVKFQSPCWSAPIISHGLMFVRGKDQLVCFELIPEANKP